MKKLTIAVAMAAGWAFADMSPVAVWPGNARDAKSVAAKLDSGELSGSFDVKFDALPGGGKVAGLFTLAVDADGVVAFELPAAPTALEGDFRVYSKDRVKPGEWHRFTFSYSLIQQFAAVYLDGKLQYENDNVFLPSLAFAAPGADEFKGEIKNLKVYDMGLTSDYLVRAKDPLAKAKRAAARVEKAKAVPSTADWANRVAQRAAKVTADSTARELMEIERDAANVERLAGEKAFGPVAFHQVRPYEQEMFLPYVLPERGVNDGTLKFYSAKDQTADASFVVTALKGLKDFTVKPSDLVCGGAKIAADKIDVKLVKRWYRAGGAWVTYFLDVRQRILTPHLFVNDDELIRVDEVRCRNLFRVNYGKNPEWVDGSIPSKGHRAPGDYVPFRDAPELRPTKQLWEAGRNQQYFMTVDVPKDATPGLYTGTLALVANGGEVGKIAVSFRVLPFTLPAQPKCHDTDHVYWTQMNRFPDKPIGITKEEKRACFLDYFKHVHQHRMNHTEQVFRSPVRAKAALEAGFVPDYLFGAPTPKFWKHFFQGVKGGDLTDADRELGLRVATRMLLPWDRFYKSLNPNAVPMVIAYSEAGAWSQLQCDQAEYAEPAHRLGWEIFAHGGERNLDFGADVQDMNSSVNLNRSEADRWHAAGGTVMAYAKPFASPENPAVHRRSLGFGRWLGFHYDGNMQHGFHVSCVGYNENAVDPGGDGNYRCVEMAYAAQNGLLYGLPWYGVKAAHDDLRYATLMRDLCRKHLESKDEDLRREAKRQMAWLERQNGHNCDMEMMRAGCADRISTMLALEAKKGVK
ncbi:MAG: LamG domain-containing protein [Kiritimatiellae bacterium]|nr:LamG domain-containing protein [Kiritimatiellia bacterium]